MDFGLVMPAPTRHFGREHGNHIRIELPHVDRAPPFANGPTRRNRDQACLDPALTFSFAGQQYAREVIEADQTLCSPAHEVIRISWRRLSCSHEISTDTDTP